MEDFAVLRQKKELRRQMRTQLSQMTREEFERVGVMALSALEPSALWREAKSVFCYWGVGLEPDTRPILRAALSAGKRLYLPRCVPRRPGVMEAVRVYTEQAVLQGENGLWEPAGNELAGPDELEISLLPCAAADETGRRLGRGGGYYDRFLEHYKGNSVIFTCERAVVSRIPTQPHDCRAKWILTEAGLRKAAAP